jgi:hypothetical protein
MEIGGVGGSEQFSSYQAGGFGARQLSPEQQQEVNRLKAIDRKVRAHEQAHMAAGAGLTGGATMQFVRGPDGRQYAVGGEVSINVSPGNSPEATIERARQIQAAALAPSDPSPQDRAVAAAAALMASQARAELSRVKREEADQTDKTQAVGQTNQTDIAANSRVSSRQQTEGLIAYLAEASAQSGQANNPYKIDQYV